MCSKTVQAVEELAAEIKSLEDLRDSLKEEVRVETVGDIRHSLQQVHGKLCNLDNKGITIEEIREIRDKAHAVFNISCDIHNLILFNDSEKVKGGM